MARWWRNIHMRSHEEELFFQAASYNDLENLPHLKSKLADMWTSHSHQATCYEALQFAAQKGYDTMVKELLLYVDVRTSSTFWCYKGAEDLPVNEAWPRWYLSGVEMTSSPLHLAVKEGHLQVVQEFVGFFQSNTQILFDRQSFEEPFVVQCWFQGIVEWAVRWGDANILKLLLTHEPFIVHPSSILSLPVHLATHYKHHDALELLLQHYKGKDALPYSIHLPPRSREGLTALHIAAQSGSLSIVELLLDHTTEMDVNVRSRPQLFTPLHMAANSGQMEVVVFLLESLKLPNVAGKDGKKVDLMARDCMGRTALHYAAREGHDDVVQRLLICAEGGMLANIADHDGLLALHMAARSGHVGVIKRLTSHAGSISNSKSRHSVNLRRMLEREYMGIKEKDSWGKLERGNFYYGEEVRYPQPKLIDSLFWKTEGFTPLHFAARYGHEAAVRELLKKASVSDLHVKDHDGLVAYDWMEVREQGDAFLKYVEEEFDRGYDLVEDLKKASFCRVKMSSELGRLKRASDIKEEKEAVKELQQAWERGTRPQITMPVVQLLEDGDIRSARRYWLKRVAYADDEDLVRRLLAVFADHFQKSDEGSLDVHMLGFKPEDAFQAFRAALEAQNFVAAKAVLVLVPALVRIEGPDVAELVKQSCLATTKIKMNLSQVQWMELFLIELVTIKERLVGASNLLRWMLPWAKQHARLQRLVEVIVDLPELKRGLYEDRQVYLDCANAILVGAALIGGLAFQGWLQPPLGYNYAYEGQGYAEVQHQAVRVFWRFNNGAFFLAVGALIAGAKGAVPVARETDIAGSVEKVKRAVAVASMLLGMALVCVMVAFTAAGFAVLPPLPSEWHMMRVSVRWGCIVCGLALIWFSSSVLPLLAQTLGHVLKTLWSLPQTLRRTGIVICAGVVNCLLRAPYTPSALIPKLDVQNDVFQKLSEAAQIKVIRAYLRSRER